MSALAVSGLRKRFGALTALDGVDLAIGADELVVVLGPTGAGKTTLLRTVAGLETPDGGTVAMGGADVTRAAPAARDVALVFQNFSLYPEWTVGENIAFPLRAPGRGLDAGAVRERVAWAARLLRLEELLDRPASRLSGGQMQRVAIGRAIVRRPRLFLMDEPLTNLDAKLREALRVELAVLRRQLDTPMLYVTHDQAEALSMADRVAVLARGRLLQVGTPEDVYRRPATPEVAQLLGQPAVNLWRAARRDGWWTTSDGLRLLPVADGHPPGSAVIGIRPEDLAPRGGDGEAVVELVEHLGPVRVVVARWGGGEIRLLLGKREPVARGDRLRPLLPPERAFVWAGPDGRGPMSNVPDPTS